MVEAIETMRFETVRDGDNERWGQREMETMRDGDGERWRLREMETMSS